MIRGSLLSTYLVIVLVALPVAAQRGNPGILGQPAPSWPVEHWANLPDGRDEIDVSDYRNKVLYLYCFQSWCPGCHKYGFPTLQQVVAEFQGNPEVEFVAVQTTFEGFHTNTFENAKRTAEQYSLDIPVGHSGSGSVPSRLMRSYRTGGTPWTVIIDRQGIVRYNDFHVSADYASTLINKLLEENKVNNSSLTMPASRTGTDMIGRKLELEALNYINTPDKDALGLNGKVTLVRWWTDTCPFCSASLPAIEQLREEFADHDFQTLAVYHPKPPRPVRDKDILHTASALGYTGNVAIDIDWSVLDENYLSRQDRPATSVTFLLDKEGIVRFVHPGPEFQSSDKPEKDRENKDYEDIRTAIRILLESDT